MHFLPNEMTSGSRTSQTSTCCRNSRVKNRWTSVNRKAKHALKKPTANNEKMLMCVPIESAKKEGKKRLVVYNYKKALSSSQTTQSSCFFFEGNACINAHTKNDHADKRTQNAKGRRNLMKTTG